MATASSKKLRKKTTSKKVVRKPALNTRKITARQFVAELEKLQSDKELEKIQRYFKSGKGEYSEGDKFIGVRMGNVFTLAKKFMPMQPAEIKKLLINPIHEVRVGAVSIMDFQARDKKINAERKKELYTLYIKLHTYINNWDLVDRAAQYVVGAYLFDKSRTPLYKLATSKNLWQRRTAIVSTSYFIRQGDYTDTFLIAELLVTDTHDLIHKAVGGWIREAGKKDRAQLLTFLDKHAATMPRTMLRYALEHLTTKQRDYYMNLYKH